MMNERASTLVSLVQQHLGHDATSEQRQAMDTFAQFMTDDDPQAVMLLSGAAGTGKTTLAAAIVKALLSLRQKMVLLAPTGRAAKVFSLYAGHHAFTIHRRIYRQRTAGDLIPDQPSAARSLSAFSLNNNLHTDTLFIVDEASMVPGTPGIDAFGSGSLLDDLITFVYQGTRCRLMLVGDQAQLPPVGEEQSPALQASVLSAYGLTVHKASMTQVLRQSQQSGILWNATRVRMLMDEVAMPKFRIKGFTDMVVVPGDELIESLASSYSRVGTDETMVITRSNKRANIYNEGIRRTVLDREEELSRGDQLMIVKNNYFWLEKNKGEDSGSKSGGLSFLANGDRCVVQRVRHRHELYGFRFADVTVLLPDYDDMELTATVLLDSLTTEAPALTREQQEQLYNEVMADYADTPLKADRMKQLRQDPHYNALQVKYGYAVTCHKAQGGQWAHVYIDQGYMTDDMLTPDYLHWLYTALTRATERVCLVNWPASETSDE